MERYFKKIGRSILQPEKGKGNKVSCLPQKVCHTDKQTGRTGHGLYPSPSFVNTEYKLEKEVENVKKSTREERERLKDTSSSVLAVSAIFGHEDDSTAAYMLAETRENFMQAEEQKTGPNQGSKGRKPEEMKQESRRKLSASKDSAVVVKKTNIVKTNTPRLPNSRRSSVSKSMAEEEKKGALTSRDDYSVYSAFHDEEEECGSESGLSTFAKHEIKNTKGEATKNDEKRASMEKSGASGTGATSGTSSFL